MKTPSANLFYIVSYVSVFALLATLSVDGEEAKPTLEERLARLLIKFPDSDANGDGQLTREEALAYKDKMQGKKAPQQTRAIGVQDARPKTGTRVSPTYVDVKYGEHALQAYDIWLAESEDGKPTPLHIYIHGGGFRGGDKSKGAAQAKHYLDKGISFASMNYRLTDGGRYPYPIPMHDAARGLQDIRSKAKEWNIDAERVVCSGGSAGAGISLWLAFHDDLAKPNSEDPVARHSTRILAAGTSGGQSTYDARTLREWFKVPDLRVHDALPAFYGLKEGESIDSERVRKLMADASPISHLDKNDVPVYMLYGKGDVPVTNETSQGVYIHHVLMGLKLKEAMDVLELECTVVSPEHPDMKYEGMDDFLIKKLQR